jgi:hypothetical protein
MSSLCVGARSNERFSAAARPVRPLRQLLALIAGLLVGAVGALLLAGSMVTLGAYTMHALLSIPTIARADANLPLWLADHPNPVVLHASSVGSKFGDASVLIALVAVSAFVLVLLQERRQARFLAMAALVEMWGYFLTKALMHSGPNRLESGFPWGTFPSERVAATIAIYGALAFLLSTHLRGSWVRSAVWASAAGIAMAVTAAGIYRGDHHLLDVAGGGAMGISALSVAMLGEQVARFVSGQSAPMDAPEVTA